MLRDGFTHGFRPELWEAAKQEARQIMIARAGRGRTIACSELVAEIKSITSQSRDPRLFHFLGEISTEEDALGHGMLAVVHKSGDMAPGPGFYDLAERLGRDTADKDRCWAEELRRVFDHWAQRHVPSIGRGSDDDR